MRPSHLKTRQDKKITSFQPAWLIRWLIIFPSRGMGRARDDVDHLTPSSKPRYARLAPVNLIIQLIQCVIGTPPDLLANRRHVEESLTAPSFRWGFRSCRHHGAQDP